MHYNKHREYYEYTGDNGKKRIVEIDPSYKELSQKAQLQALIDLEERLKYEMGCQFVVGEKIKTLNQ